jgi:hypothetical protein
MKSKLKAEDIHRAYVRKAYLVLPAHQDFEKTQSSEQTGHTIPPNPDNRNPPRNDSPKMWGRLAFY